MVEAEKLKTSLSLQKVTLFNDFQANAYGLLGISDEKDAKLISGRKMESNNEIKFVMGPGTGIGEAILKKSELPRSYEVISTEGGHKGFSPVTDEHIEYLIYLRKKKNSNFIS